MKSTLVNAKTTATAAWTPKAGTKADAIRRLVASGVGHTVRELASEVGCSLSWARKVANRLSSTSFADRSRERTAGGPWRYVYRGWSDSRDVLAVEDAAAAINYAVEVTSNDSLADAWEDYAAADEDADSFAFGALAA